MDDMRLVVMGAGGRMGRALVAAIAQTPGLRLEAAIARAGSVAIGMPVEGVAFSVTDDIEAALADADGVIDFTTPAATVALGRQTARLGLVHVIGTTGCSAADDAAIAEAAAAGARIVKSGNMSLGVNLLAGLVKMAARALPGEAFDIEVLEMHHRHKVDAPSGTALLLGKAAAEGRGVLLEEASVRVRDGHTGARPVNTIGFATLRGGSVVGDHQVILAGEGERIELSHRAEDRSIFARGALRAALWARDRKPGLYTMQDVLGLGASL